jgi:hypothetical protein
MNWEKLFRDYLTAVYNQDHIVAQRAIDELEAGQEKKEAQGLYDFLEACEEVE